MSVWDVLQEAVYSMRLIACISVFAAFSLKKRLHFALRLLTAGSATVALGASFLFIVDALHPYLTETGMTLLHIFWYCGFLVLLFGLLTFLYRGDLLRYAFSFSCGCLIECAVFGCFRLSYDFGIFEIRVNTPLSYFAELAFSAFSCLILYLVLRKSGKTSQVNFPASAVILYFGAVGLTMFLRLALQSIYEIVLNESSSWIINIALCFIPLFVFCLVVAMTYALRFNIDKDILNRLLLEKETQYKMSAENVEIINRKCHDIKRQLRALDFTDEEGRKEAISEMLRSVSIYDSQVKTSNAALNTLLSEKGLYCTEHGIRLTNIIDGDAVSFMTPVDIFTLFGNMLDNAIEAVEHIEKKEKQVISLTVQRRGGFVVIEMNNYYTGIVELKDGIPKTSKRDDRMHGFGISSVRQIAMKYGGAAEIALDGDIFIITVTIPEQ